MGRLRRRVGPRLRRQLIALAEAIPAEKFAWWPVKGVRSVSEVYMHIGFCELLPVKRYRTEITRRYEVSRHGEDGDR